VVFATAAVVLNRYGDGLGSRPWPTPTVERNVILRALTVWDGSWYVHVAAHGYPGRADRALAFFPAYPLTVRAVARTTGLGYPAAAVAVALLLGTVAAVLLWELSRLVGGTAFADRTVVLFSFFPGSFVLSLAYSEPLMLAASLACLLALHRRAWVAAGMLGAVATASRPNAVVVVACCAWAALAARRTASGYRPLLAPALSVTGVVSYYAFLWARTGSPWAWFGVQRQLWNERLAPGNTLRRLDAIAGEVVRGRQPDINALLGALGLVFCVAAFVLLLRWRPPAVIAIYAVGIVGLAVTAGTIGLRPRFVLTAFPLVQAVAWRVRGTFFVLAVAVSAMLLVSLTIVSVVTVLAVP
jgi:hypothetical protein